MALSAFALSAAGPAHAAPVTFKVTKIADTNDGICEASDCSLREAVVAANATAPGPNFITLPAGNYKLTRSGQGEQAAATGDLDITRSVAIIGASASTTTIDGNAIDRVFDMLTGASLSVSRATLRGGNPSPESDFGGAIRNADGSLTLIQSTVTANRAGSGHGGYGGAIEISGGAAALTISDSTISGNSAGGTAAGDYGYGGAVDNNSTGATTITRSHLDNNHAGSRDFGYGGAINAGGSVKLDSSSASYDTAGGGSSSGFGYGGAISAGGSVTATGSRLDHDSAGGVSNGQGGAIDAAGAVSLSFSSASYDTVGGGSSDGYGYGGAIKGGGTVTADHSTLDRDRAGGGGAFGYGGAIDSAELATITSSTISRSAAGGGGQSGFGYGGGVNAPSGVVLRNSTVSGNSAGGGSANAFGYGGGIVGPINATSSTIAGNSAAATVQGGQGGGVDWVTGSAKNTIIADNTSAKGANCGSKLASNGHNLENGASCGFTGSGDANAAPKLGPLANNGGPTETRALLPQSPAINAGGNCPPPTADQRGAPRPQFGVCDKGAFEVQRPPRITATINPSKHKATFSFTSVGATGFRCALVKKQSGTTPKPTFSPCKSPKTYTNLKTGNYVFEVRAVSPAGPGPIAKRAFTI